jgi:hypothetical protein
MKGEKEREALAREFDRHRAEEGEILERYHALSDQLGKGPLGLLINHIATEEEMHHFLLGTLSDWLRSPVSPGEALSERRVDRNALLRETRMLRGHEKKTIEACRGLQAQLSGDEGMLFDTILEAIASDSEKHQRLLEAVEKLIP